LHGRIGVWTAIVCESIFVLNALIPHEHELYFMKFAHPMYWFWRVLNIAVIIFAVLYLRKGAVIARYVAACIILVRFFVIDPVHLLSLDIEWYYAFIPNLDAYQSGIELQCALGIRMVDLAMCRRRDPARDPGLQAVAFALRDERSRPCRRNCSGRTSPTSVGGTRGRIVRECT
jgi:hypothetical protein